MSDTDNGMDNLIKSDVTIKTVQNDQEMIKNILKNRPEIRPEYLIKMMKYNFFTTNQLSAITGQSPNKIATLANPSYKPKEQKVDCELTRCHPFPEMKGSDEELGRVYIYRDEKCEKFILDNNK